MCIDSYTQWKTIITCKGRMTTIIAHAKMKWWFWNCYIVKAITKLGRPAPLNPWYNTQGSAISSHYKGAAKKQSHTIQIEPDKETNKKCIRKL